MRIPQPSFFHGVDRGGSLLLELLLLACEPDADEGAREEAESVCDAVAEPCSNTSPGTCFILVSCPIQFVNQIVVLAQCLAPSPHQPLNTATDIIAVNTPR